MHTRSLNLYGCAIPVHELLKRLITSIITDTVSFKSINPVRRRAFLRLDPSTVFSPRRRSVPSLLPSCPLASSSASSEKGRAAGGQGGPKARHPEIPRRGRRRGGPPRCRPPVPRHCPVAMVATLRLKAAAPPDYGESNMCFCILV